MSTPSGGWKGGDVDKINNTCPETARYQFIILIGTELLLPQAVSIGEDLKLSLNSSSRLSIHRQRERARWRRSGSVTGMI